MSASAANVFSGLISATIPAAMNRTPKSQKNQLHAVDQRRDRELLEARSTRNMIPTITPTVVIEAWSNWRIDQADERPADPEHEPEPPHPRDARDGLPARGSDG